MPTPPQWHATAACNANHRPDTITPAEWSAYWVPAKGNTTPEGLALCSGCSHRVECLEHGLQLQATYQADSAENANDMAPVAGTWGSIPAGKNTTWETLAGLFRAGHRYLAGCNCGYCIRVAQALDLRPGEQAPPLGPAFGPRAQHGRSSTYARRCKCRACEHAHRCRRLRDRRMTEPSAITAADIIASVPV